MRVIFELSLGSVFVIDSSLRQGSVSNIDGSRLLFRVDLGNDFDIIMTAYQGRYLVADNILQQDCTLFDMPLQVHHKGCGSFNFSSCGAGENFWFFSVDFCDRGSTEHLGRLRIGRDGITFNDKPIKDTEVRRLWTKHCVLGGSV